MLLSMRWGLGIGLHVVILKLIQDLVFLENRDKEVVVHLSQIPGKFGKGLLLFPLILSLCYKYWMY